MATDMRDADVRVTFEDSTGARAPTTIAFRRDATRRGRVVRASGAGGTGHATRLARVDDDDDGRAVTPARVSRAYDRATIDVRGATFARDIVPPLSRLVDSRETTQRQFGTLGACGAAVQIRFGRARDDDDACEAIDGALTIDPLHPKMETCGDRLGDFILEGAAALGSRAASVGKNPSVWTPAKLREGDDGYVAGEDKYEDNWRGPGKLASDMRAYRGTQSEAGPMLEHLAARDARAAALRCRVHHLERVRVGLDRGVVGVVPDTSLATRVVDAALIDRLHADAAVYNPRTGETTSLRALGVFFDDVEGLRSDELTVKIDETRRAAAHADDVVRSMRRELDARVAWDEYESGVETRDVLENGVRRADMERLLGRGVTKADVDASMKMPERARAAIVGAYDVEASRRTGRYIAAADSAETTARIAHRDC